MVRFQLFGFAPLQYFFFVITAPLVLSRSILCIGTSQAICHHSYMQSENNSATAKFFLFLSVFLFQFSLYSNLFSSIHLWSLIIVVVFLLLSGSVAIKLMIFIKS